MSSELELTAERGYTLVYTGEGKGKTTAAIGLAVRATGHGKRVLMLQWIKSAERLSGEHAALKRLGVEVRLLGAGFTWTQTPQVHRQALAEAWTVTKREVMSGQWDVVILDELNTALSITRFPIADVLSLQQVLDLLKQRPSHVHVVLTGRGAPQEVLEQADLVTHMQEVKHYYRDGVSAVRGLDC